MVVPTAIVVRVGVRFFEERDGRAAGEDEIIDGRTALDADGVVEAVCAGTVGQDDFGLATVGAEFARAGDTNEGLGARIGLHLTHCFELALVGEGVSDL